MSQENMDFNQQLLNLEFALRNQESCQSNKSTCPHFNNFMELHIDTNLSNGIYPALFHDSPHVLSPEVQGLDLQESHSTLKIQEEEQNQSCDVDPFSSANLGAIPVKTIWEQQDWKSEFENMIQNANFSNENDSFISTDLTRLVEFDETRRYSDISMASAITYGTDSMDVSLASLMNPFSPAISMVSPMISPMIPVSVGISILGQLDQHMLNQLDFPAGELMELMGIIEMCIMYRKHELNISIIYPKVAQKSYGNEKRFLCPHPMVRLDGDGMLPFNQLGCKFNVVNSENTSQNLSGMLSADEPLFERNSLYASTKGITGWTESSVIPTSDQDRYGTVSGATCEFRKLYISSLGDQKVFKLAFQLFNTETDVLLGRFVTDTMKLLSKPAKITSTKQDLYITNGSCIGLFNRINSQTGSTRYLGLDEKWEPFRVWILEELVPFLDQVGLFLSQIPTNGLCLPLSQDQKALFQKAIHLYSHTYLSTGKPAKPVQYGNRVILQHKESGTISVPMRIKLLSDSEEGKKKKSSKSEKLFYAARQEGSCSVSQLQKVGFQLDNDMFLSYVNTELDGVYSRNYNDGNAADILQEHSVWGLVGIDVLEYTIYAELDRQAPHNPPEGLLNLSTIPKITVVNQAEDHVLVLTGTGFTSNLYVFFGMIPAKNKRLRNNTMRVELLENLTVSLEPLPTPCEKVPILFIREDRIMFRSEFYLYVSV